MKADHLRLILVTHKSEQTPLPHYLDFVSRCIDAGVTAVQLRQKNMSAAELLQFGLALLNLLKPKKIPLIINDHIQLCQQLDAEGVHLGQTDGDIDQARRLLGKRKIIGLSVDSLLQLEQANNLPIDYVGIGAIFPTNNKADIKQVWQLAGLEQAVQISVHPVIAIGGISTENVQEVIQAGPAGIAAIGLFHDVPNPYDDIAYITQLITKSYYPCSLQ